MTTTFSRCVALLVATIVCVSSSSQPISGELIVDHPTLINLGFEWLIDGDANRNAQVAVSYRKQGDAQWKQGLPLLRLQGERIYQRDAWDLVSPNMFAGSILDLQPDTAYEARFVLSDLDGIGGQRERSVTRAVSVRTRPEPKPYSGGKVFHVYPSNYNYMTNFHDNAFEIDGSMHNRVA